MPTKEQEKTKQAILIDEGLEKSDVRESKAPCPECGNNEWLDFNVFVVGYSYDYTIHSLHMEPLIDNEVKLEFYDICVYCETIVSIK